MASLNEFKDQAIEIGGALLVSGGLVHSAVDHFNKSAHAQAGYIGAFSVLALGILGATVCGAASKTKSAPQRT